VPERAETEQDRIAVLTAGCAGLTGFLEPQHKLPRDAMRRW